MKKALSLVAVIAMSIFFCVAQSSPIQSLSVGDKIPEIQVTNIINSASSNIRLSDYKGKLIILDFWAATCGSCIVALPRLDSLQKQFGDDIKIITVTKLDSVEKIRKTLHRFNVTRNLGLPIVITDRILYQYFPYQFVSHVVWINGEGIVKAITGVEYVTGDNIRQLLAGRETNWPVKKDVFDYDYHRPLLGFLHNEVTAPPFIFYSGFMGNIEGIGPPNGIIRDSIQKISSLTFYNYSLATFCQLALDFNTGARQDQFILHVKRPSRYFKPGNEFYEQWNKKNTFCYSINLPLDTPVEEIRQIVKEDLQRWLGIMGIEVKKDVRSADGKPLYVITEKNFKKTF